MPGQTTALALTHFAGRAGDHNDGAMLGSLALADEFARRLGVEPTVVGAPEPALGAGWAEELAAARPALTVLRERYAEVLASGARPVTALSRCAVALATLPAVARQHPGAAVVWFDAHADLNTPGTTGTGYLGGLALSGPLGLWDSGLGAGLPAGDVVLVGVRDLDPPEQVLIDRARITVLPPGPDLSGRLADAVGPRPAYVHIDCDVLEPDTVPTDYRVPGGLTLPELHAASETIAALGVVGLEVGEFEAAEDPRETERAARVVVDAVQPLLDALAGAG